MKIENRQVFIANDETIFFVEADCIAYERRSKLREVVNAHLIYGNEVNNVNDLIDALIALMEQQA